MRRKIVIGFIAILIGACHPKAIPQNEDMAIGVANLFITALAHGQYEEIYEDYMEDMIKEKPQNSLEGFQQYYLQVQDEYGPITQAVFLAYQAVPEESAIQLFYKITHEKKGEIEYHLVLSGDANRSYKVKVLDIGNLHPYPPDITDYPDLKRMRMRKVGVVEINLGLPQ